jgi:hypothetical protein
MTTITGQRKWARREVDFSARLVFPTRGIREVNTAIFQLQNLSEGGASIYVGAIKSVPDFFYLQFGDENSELVGCYLVERTAEILRCRFSSEMETSQVDEIIARSGMTSMLDTLFAPSRDDLIDDVLSLF